MSKKYCLRINNPGGIEIDMDKLNDFVKQLYITKSKDKDTKKLNFVTYSFGKDSICLKITGNPTLKNIEEINSRLMKEDLQVEDSGIYLSEPYVLDATQVLSFDVTPGRKWDSIIQRGPYFSEIMKPYEYLGASLYLDDQEYKLTREEEKFASLYAKRMISEDKGNITLTYTKPSANDNSAKRKARNLFNKNFWSDFYRELSPKGKKFFKKDQDPREIDWTHLKERMIEKESNAKQDKDQKSRKDAEILAEYGYVTINDVPLQKLGNYKVEDTGIFYGRGGNRVLGKIKKQPLPEEVTLNMGEGDPEPLPPPNHEWGGIVHAYNKEWFATWKDNVTNRNKYVWLSSDGAFKAQSDAKKYEKARKLHQRIEKIREDYMEYAKSDNKIKLEIGTVLYLIDHFGIRVGNETDEDEADTVGATTLLCDNVQLVPNGNHVIFDFDGKDSIHFYKDLEVDPVIFKNFQELKKKKGGSEQIFKNITSKTVNEYLKTFDEDFSAKVFRTRLASSIMYCALKGLKIEEKSTKKNIKKEFAKANAEVAEVLNHVRTPSGKANEALKKLKDDLAEATLKKDTKKIKTLKENIEIKENVLTVAINTSLSNYIDPRLVVSWAKTNQVDPSDIYTKTLFDKFKWAIDRTEEEWDWETEPIEDQDEESPAEPPKSTRKPTISTTPPRKPGKINPKVETPSERKPIINISITPPREPRIKLGPGTIEDYRLILQLCEEFDIYRENIKKVRPEFLEWIYPLCKDAVEKRGVKVEATKYIVEYYESRIDETPVNESKVLRKPPQQDSKKVPSTTTPSTATPKKTTPSTATPSTTTPSTATPKKTKEKTKEKKIIITEEGFTFLNYRIIDDIGVLRDYCKNYKIPINAGYTKNQIKQAIIDYYKSKGTPIDKISIF